MPESPDIERLQIEGLADYHCHCDYSIDAEGSIEEYCRAAVQRDLVELCFTTHYDSNPQISGCADFIRVNGQDREVSPENLVPYVEHVQRARDEFYAHGLSVKLGLEFGWYPGCEEAVHLLRHRFPFDHVICGLHEIENICFCCEECYHKCFEHYRVTEIVERYIAELASAVKCEAFDCLAHLDYLRRFGLEYYGPEIDAALLDRCQSHLFPLLANSRTALEVNTSSVRKDLEPYFPKLSLLNAARRAGVDIRYLGSDAHRPQDVGFDFDIAAALLSSTEASCDID